MDTRTATVADRLRTAGCLAAEEEAAELVSAAADPGALDGLVRRREAGEPLAWITGRTVFCGRTLVVDPGVYVPRPHSEELVRRAAAVVGSGRVADLCTGSGAVAATLEALAPAARAVGIDLDPRAVACARRNGVRAVRADLGEPLAGASFDVVTAVAPYVPSAELPFLPRDVLAYEPLGALEGGANGLEVVRRVVTCAARLLRPGGWVLVELGGRQDEALRPVLAGFGFGDVDSWDDEEGDLRGLMARLQ